MALNGPKDTKMNFFMKFGQFIISHHTKGYFNPHENSERNDTLENKSVKQTEYIFDLRKRFKIFQGRKKYQSEKTGTPFHYASASDKAHDYQWYSGRHQHVSSKIISASME